MALARRLIIRRASLGSIGRSVSFCVLPAAERKSGAFLVAGDAGRFDIGVQVGVGVVVGGHLVPLAALLVQAEPGPAAFQVIILDPHAEGGADAGEGIDHDADQGPVAQADQRGGVDAVEELAGLLGGEHGRLAAFDAEFRAAYRAGRIEGDDAAADQPVEQHADGGQVLLDGGGGFLAG